ncbi:MAG TPA: TatD family hydrolase [Verrucomicrobiae bacterium]|nr:TatD family hydrolase [Verrucomicrobiae bacterium]
MAEFFDTHAHLDYSSFASDMNEVIARAQSAGISKIISIGTTLDSSRRAVELARTFSNVYAVVGWHPSEAAEAPDDFRSALRELARQPKVAAIGETGLDYHRLPDSESARAQYKRRQAALFEQHLEVALEFGLNCVIHQRDAFEDTLAQLKPFAQRVRGVFHCFGESSGRMKQVLEIGSLVSFTGIITFKNGQNARETVAATPLGKFMLETDCPYLAPVPYRGKRCEPAYVKEISETVVQVKKCSPEELSAATCGTAREFFRNLDER